jgi:hypothetical protein
MKYLKKEGDQILYPYDIEDFKRDNPNTSLVDNLSNEFLAQFNMFPVNSVANAGDHTKNYTEGNPTLSDGEYFQNWIESNASQQEIDIRVSGQWDVIRSIRSEYLRECDWTQLRDSPLPESKRGEWVVYRQSLRDITKQTNPFNIVWPVKPQ